MHSATAALALARSSIPSASAFQNSFSPLVQNALDAAPARPSVVDNNGSSSSAQAGQHMVCRADLVEGKAVMSSYAATAQGIMAMPKPDTRHADLVRRSDVLLH